ncbi:MAG: hypothetical protein R3B96_09715 [Pirellulaceae bacterium]
MSRLRQDLRHFRQGSAREYAEQSDLPFLGALPITMSVREKADHGEMWGLFDEPTVAAGFDAIARQMVTVIAQRNAANPPVPCCPCSAEPRIRLGVSVFPGQVQGPTRPPQRPLGGLGVGRVTRYRWTVKKQSGLQEAAGPSRNR